MVHFWSFLWDLWKKTGDYWYNHSMWPIILVYFSQLKLWEDYFCYTHSARVHRGHLILCWIVNDHTSSFRHESQKHATALSTHVWDKELGPEPDIEWSILVACHGYFNNHQNFIEKILRKQKYDPFNRKNMNFQKNSKVSIF